MNINIYYLKLIFTLVNFFLPLEIDEKRNTEKDLIFEIKRQKALEKRLNCKFIKINASNDLEYEISYIQKFIDELKNNKIKELENEIKELGDRNNKATDFILKEAKLSLIQLLIKNVSSLLNFINPKHIFSSLSVHKNL